MPQFSYKARRRTGEIVQGVLDVADRGAAVVQIEKLGLFPVAVDAAKGGATSSSGAGAAAPRQMADMMPPALKEFLNRQRKPRLQELATFTQQLANLLNAGMPLTVALNSMTHLETKGIPADISRQLKADVMEGKSLSDAMKRQPLIFSDLYVNMVKAGEQSGALVEVLRRMADHFERFAAVQAKFKSALIYPSIVASIGVLIMIFFVTVMLPKFMTIFQGMNVELPLMTRMLLGLSDFLKKYWWVVFGTIAAAAVLFRRYQTSEQGRQSLHRLVLNVPVFGKVIRLNLFGQFARTLATLLRNGVPVLTALQISEEVMPNHIVKQAIAKTREEVTDGKTLAQPLGRSKIFPQLMVDLVKIGEETGDVPSSLENIATTYENELNIALRVLMDLIEPAMIIVMALGVGFLLLSVLSAMFAITSNIAR